MGQHFLTDEECRKIEDAIVEAELNCSGEIRVHIDRHCSDNVLDDAAKRFARLKMHKTKLRNGVLFYLASEDHKFAVIGDKGINALVDSNFWNDVCETMSQFFQKGDFVEGLTAGIKLCGRKLRELFPYGDDDENELPNEITFGEN